MNPFMTQIGLIYFQKKYLYKNELSLTFMNLKFSEINNTIEVLGIMYFKMLPIKGI